MTGPDASSGEMRRVSMPGRAGRDHDEVLLDLILDRRPLPADAPAGMRALAGNLAGLAAAPGGGELPGQAAALAAFARSGRPASTLTLPLPGGPAHRRRGGRLTAGRARLAAAAAVIAVAVSGTAAAAYAGVLPASVQNFAHHVIDAPAAHPVDHHGRGAAGQQGSHPGAARPAPPGPRKTHPAKPGKQNGHNGRGHHVKRAKKPKPAHPAHPAHSPRPAKARASQSPSPASR